MMPGKSFPSSTPNHHHPSSPILLSRLLLDRKKDAAQMLNALSHFDGNLIVSILQLDLFEHREGDRIDKDDATIDAAGVHDKDLLIALLQTEEFRL